MKWHAAAQTNAILNLMSPLNRKKVSDAIRSGRRMVGTVYRRTRPDENGIKRQRAEVRFDDVAGCLRTPAGGSSRQIILVVEGKTVRSRLLSPREAARLMGLDDDFVLPERYNHAYHVCGDGVCVPVVRHIAQYVLEPALVVGGCRGSSQRSSDGDRHALSPPGRSYADQRIGCYVLCDLDQVPIYVDQSVDGIRSRVNRHLTSARSDIMQIVKSTLGKSHGSGRIQQRTERKSAPLKMYCFTSFTDVQP